MARDREDLQWQHFSHPDQWHERLRWARETHGAYASAKDFAKKVGEEPAAYRKYERTENHGRNSAKTFPLEKARKFAAALGVSWEWLRDAEGVPWLDESPGRGGPADEVKALVQSEPPEEQERILEVVRLMVRKAG